MPEEASRCDLMLWSGTEGGNLTGQDTAAEETGVPEWVVPLRPSQHGTPFFLVHPVGGSVIPYMRLAQLIEDKYEVYGIEARGLHGAEADLTLESAAAAYVTALRLIQPAGPYLLGGWSLGGAIAFEMARQLAAGDPGSFVFLLDADPDWTMPGISDDSRLLASFAEDLARQTGRPSPVMAFSASALSQEAKIELVVRRIIGEGIVPPMLEDHLRRRIGVFMTFSSAYASYRPGPADVPARLFATRDGAARQLAVWNTLAHVHGGVCVLDADHYTLLREPHVTQLAAELNAAIRAAG